MYKFMGLALLAAIFSAQAATVTITGDDVKFTYDDSTVFGTANVVGNSFFFLPTNFKAESLDGNGVATMNATIQIEVEVITAGVALRELRMLEEGDYFLGGDGASVRQSGQLAVTSQTQLCGGLFPCRGTSLFDAGPLTAQGTLTPWSADAGINLADTPEWGSDTRVTVTLENLLTATSLNQGVGEQAFLEKKFAAIGLLVDSAPPVPVPAAAWLFGSALAWLTLRRRKP